jgi:ADP-heptose:LPS heptosyltransferase
MHGTYEIKNGSPGIGDAVLGMTVVAAMRKRYPSAELIYTVHPHAAPFVELFEGYDALCVSDGGFPLQRPDKVFDLYSAYPIELAERGKKSRAEYYAAVCGVEPCLPDHRPLPPSSRPGCICFAPYSTWHDRDWLLPNWRALEDMLRAAGEKVVVLHDQHDNVKEFKGEKIIGAKAFDVAALIKEAKVVIGGDTGMIHIAGCLQTRAVALCAQVRGSQVYGVYPSVAVLDGKLPCSGCYWQAVPLICRSVCASLNQITPQEVFEHSIQRVT